MICNIKYINKKDGTREKSKYYTFLYNRLGTVSKADEEYKNSLQWKFNQLRNPEDTSVSKPNILLPVFEKELSNIVNNEMDEESVADYIK